MTIRQKRERVNFNRTNTVIYFNPFLEITFFFNFLLSTLKGIVPFFSLCESNDFAID